MVPWCRGLRVRVSTEERRVRGLSESRADPTQEKVRGLPPSQDPGRLQVRRVGRPDSRGPGMWMSGNSVRAEEERGGAWDPRGGDPECDPERDLCLGA